MTGQHDRMAMQDGVGGWRGRMAWEDGDAVGMAEWHGRVAEQTP